MPDIYQQTALSEYGRVAADYATEKKSKTALAKSYQRHEALIATSIDQASVKPACEAGCAYCCHYKVEVRAHEVFLIKEFMESSLPVETRLDILKEAEVNEKVIRSLTAEQHLTTNIKCPFLIDKQCGIYPVRPFRCRNYHATDANICAASFDAPTDMSIATNIIESVALFGDAHTQGYEAAVHQKGFDSRVYDFTSALLEAFREATALKRYKKGKKSFLTAIEVDQAE